MRISEYPNVAGLSSNDLFIIDTANGTRTVTSETLIHDISEMVKPDPILPEDLSTVTASDSLLFFKEGKFYKINPSDAFFQFFNAFSLAKANRKMVRRNKNLGSEITEAQAAAIESGSFDDIYIGDYWRLNYSSDISWDYYVADINYQRISELQKGYSRKPNLILLRAISIATPCTIQMDCLSSASDLSTANFKYLQKPEEMKNSYDLLSRTVAARNSKIRLVVMSAGMQPSKMNLTSSGGTGTLGMITSWNEYSDMSVVASISQIDNKMKPYNGTLQLQNLVTAGMSFEETLALFAYKDGIFTLHGLSNFLPAFVITSGCLSSRTINYTRFINDNSTVYPYDRSDRSIVQTSGKSGTFSTVTLDEQHNILKFTFENSQNSKAVLLPVLYCVEGLNRNTSSY